MSKILVLANDSTYLYNTRIELIQKLISLGYEVKLVCDEKMHVEEFEKIGCNIIGVNLHRRGTNPFEDLFLLNSYKKIIKEEKPNIVLTFNIKPNIYGGMVCKKYKIPYLENITGLGTAVETPGIMQKITVKLYKFALSKANVVFFQNKENEQFFTDKKIAIGRHKIIPGSGVNLTKYKLLEYPNENIVNFIFVSRLLRQKGIDNYLDAAEYFANRKDLKFNIIGFCEDDEYLAKIKDLENRGIVKYYGEQKSLVEFYKKSSCTILPTYYPEGMNNVLLESAASGRPIITTNRSGCREIIDDGINGYICKQNDSDNLIKQINKFLNLSFDDRKKMGLNGRIKVEKEFDRNIVINDYLDEINKINKK